MTDQTPESPAALLRRAAAHIRQLADAATPPPWTAVPRYRKGTDVIAQYDITKPPRPGSNIPQEKHAHPSTAADELYSVAMHPGVGLAVAELLDVEANVADDMQRQSPALTDQELAAWVHGPLAIARAILGSTS